MKICYWNTCNESTVEELTEQCDGLKDQHGIDVFCLQEVPYLPDNTRTPASVAIASALDFDSVFEHTRTLRKSAKRLKGYGTAILSASEITDVSKETLRDDPFAYMTPGKGNKRALLAVETADAPGVIVSVAHLSYRLPFGLGSRGLTKERERLVDCLDALAKDSEVLFGGDLNCPPEASLDGELAAVGFVGLDAQIPTFRSRHWYAGHLGRNLDRVFHTTGLTGDLEVGDFGCSDHRPVFLEVEMAQQ